MFFVRDPARRASGRFVVHSSALARHWNNNRSRRLVTPTRSAPDDQAKRQVACRCRHGTSSASSNARQAMTSRSACRAKVPMDPYPAEAHMLRAHRAFRQATVIQITREARAIKPDRRTLRQGREIGANEAIPASLPRRSRAQSFFPRGKPAFAKVTWITFPALNQSYVRSIKTSCTPACRR
jgi:hypothetical protein